ncbi:MULTISPECIES: hypothetical protein [Lactobacillus]|uniref:Uncharacterized protein n=1 Tax=Lactobacillus xujianguonis TaxID=2495899 RepID=A0A437SWD5_9LACO|nr:MULTISPECIES: hypothetical protein [Lactobacillus]RVU71241.1 hypothetical protein EJK17_03340 [Lactobacillus xujianguonis]RVU74104.1 hypothetical protein EJK20_04700 [Lactobacillus xujianguonis]
MSFNPNQGKRFAAALKESSNNSENISREVPTSEASNYIQREKRRAYTLSLTPSARAKLTEVAKSHGYNSSSSFLNDMLLQDKL